MENIVQRLQREVKILEDEENGKIRNHIEDKDSLFCFPVSLFLKMINPEREEIIAHDRSDHRENEPRLAVSIENEAGDEKNPVAGTVILHKIISKKNDRKEKKYEDNTGKNHSALALAAAGRRCDFSFEVSGEALAARRRVYVSHLS
jgi:hypothetical protein